MAPPRGGGGAGGSSGGGRRPPRPASRLGGVGPRTEAALHALSLRTLGDVAAREPSWLEQKLGSGGARLRELALGVDDRPVVPDRQQKSLGAEDTFEEDLAGEAALRPHLHAQALRVGRRLRQAGLAGRVVVLKLKLADFTLLTRRRTLAEPTDDGQLLYRAALELLAGESLAAKVRLTGVSAQELTPKGAGQLGLFGGKPRAARVNAALDAIAECFGSGAVTTADLADRPEREDDEARRLVGAARFDRGLREPAEEPEGRAPHGPPDPNRHSS